jgi:hypothetical protein
VRSLVLEGVAWPVLARLMAALLVFDVICLVLGVRVFRRSLA